MYYAIVGVIFFATWAMMVQQGFWNNVIQLAQILISGLVAFGFYQPLTIWADEKLDGQYTYYLDLVVLWGIYSLTMLILKVLAKQLSGVRMRFPNPMDPVGGPVVGLIAGLVMAGIVGASLHMAALGKDTLGGKLAYTEDEVESASSFTAPDLAWLRFVERCSEAGFLGSGQKTFSASDFVLIYGDHRAKFEETEGFLVKRS